MQVTGTYAEKRPDARRVFAVALTLFLLLDLFFVGAHVVRAQLVRDPTYDGFLADSAHWSLGIDRSYSERFSYLKTGLAALLLLLLYERRRAVTYLAWGLTLSFILLDDALELHERTGAALISHAGLPTVAGIGGDLYAEMILWLSAAVPLLGLIALGYRRDRGLRRLSRWFLGLLAALFFFGGVVDALHAAAPYVEQPTVRFFLARTLLLEDGGEMVVLSLLCALTLLHALTERHRNAPLAGP